MLGHHRRPLPDRWQPPVMPTCCIMYLVVNLLLWAVSAFAWIVYLGCAYQLFPPTLYLDPLPHCPCCRISAISISAISVAAVLLCCSVGVAWYHDSAALGVLVRSWYWSTVDTYGDVQRWLQDSTDARLRPYRLLQQLQQRRQPRLMCSPCRRINFFLMFK